MNSSPHIEINPFKPFVPENISVLIIGSFPGKEQTQVEIKNEWFYGARRNQFWKIMSLVYHTQLDTTEAKKALFRELGIGVTDIILKAKRTNNTNLDENLEIVEYNDAAIRDILERFPQVRVFFTSRFVEKQVRKHIPGLEQAECLPSPSPRYARMNIAAKADYYRDRLPLRKDRE